MFIYALVCPQTQQVRYIGKTISPSTRLQSHISSSKRAGKKSPLSTWITSLLADHKKPNMRILHEFDSTEWGYWEGYYFDQYQPTGLLLNILPLSRLKHDKVATAALIKKCRLTGLSTRNLGQLIGASYSEMHYFLKGNHHSLSANKVKLLAQIIEELRPQAQPFDLSQAFE